MKLPLTPFFANLCRIAPFAAALFFRPAYASQLPEDLSQLPAFAADKLDVFVDKFSLHEAISDRFDLDLNDDGQDDKLIGVTCGNAGCDYYIFVSAEKGLYKFAGNIFASRTLEILRYFGRPSDLITWVPMANDSGQIIRYTYTANGYRYVKRASYEGPSSLARLIVPPRHKTKETDQ